MSVRREKREKKKYFSAGERDECVEFLNQNNGRKMLIQLLAQRGDRKSVIFFFAK